MERQHNNEEIQRKLNEWNERKENNAQNTINENHNLITIEISGFFEKKLTINEAKVYNERCLKKNEFLLAMSGINKSFLGDIKVNGLSVKNNKYIAKYLQSSSLILTKDTFLHQHLTLKQNLKILSLIYANYDLSDATISSFSMKEFANTVINCLSENKKKLAILSLSVACPAMLWIIDETLLSNLTEEETALWENVVKIRTKHGGAVVLI